MKTPPSLLPDLSTLTARLTAALDGDGRAGPPVRVLERNVPRFMSTFPNEIVTCQLPDGQKRHVFAKYQAGQSHASFGHRGDIPYEAEVYRRLLQPLPDFRPKCLGAYTDSTTGDTSLFLEYVYRSVRVSDLSWKRATRQPRALTRTARWIGQFHAAHEARVGDPSLAFLRRYDAEYYRGWARRMFEFTRPLQGRFPWLTQLSETGDEWFAPLLMARPTVIHGEFYAKTILIRGQKLFAVDWESAAIAPGEIDLAALTEGTGWPAKLVRECAREYQRARWPGGAPDGFRQRLGAARLYLHLRWLGDSPDKPITEKHRWRFRHLRAGAKRLGLV